MKWNNNRLIQDVQMMTRNFQCIKWFTITADRSNDRVLMFDVRVVNQASLELIPIQFVHAVFVLGTKLRQIKNFFQPIR